MTRKDFELIAGVIASMPEPGPDDYREFKGKLALRFAEVLKGTNPRFKAERFVRACMEVK